MAIVDYFLKIEGVAGESQDDAHKGDIDVLSFSWGVSNAGSMAVGSGGGEGKASFHDLSFTHKIDKASPVLMQSCASGVHLKEAVLIARRSASEGKGEEFLKITLSDVLISSYQVGAQDTVTNQPPIDVAAALFASDTTQLDTNGPATTFENVAVSYRAVKFTEGPRTHINVRAAAAGQLAIDPATGDLKITDSQDGVVRGGTQVDPLTGRSLNMRAVQEYDVTDLLGLLSAPLETGKLTLTVNEVRPTPGDGGGEQQGPVPHLHFDVVMYSPADGELTLGDLVRKGKRLGSLHLDPRGDPASLELDLGDEALRAGGTFGIRLQLRGHPIDLGAINPPEPDFVAETADDVGEDEDAGKALGQDRFADFTFTLAFDSN